MDAREAPTGFFVARLHSGPVSLEHKLVYCHPIANSEGLIKMVFADGEAIDLSNAALQASCAVVDMASLERDCVYCAARNELEELCGHLGHRSEARRGRWALLPCLRWPAQA